MANNSKIFYIRMKYTQEKKVEDLTGEVWRKGYIGIWYGKWEPEDLQGDLDKFDLTPRDRAVVRRFRDIGLEDWVMYPLIQPGSLVLIDEGRRKILATGWTNEFERPIYFLEHRGGYACGWCTVIGNQLILQPHPASMCTPEVYLYPEEVEVLGQVTGVAMRLDQGKRRRARQ